MQTLIGSLCLIVATAAGQAGDVAELVKQLKSEDQDVRRSAAKALGDRGPQAKAAVPALTEALKDKDLFVRRFAAQSLGEIGPDSKPAIPALVNALGDSRKEVVDAAVRSLGKLGPDGIKALAETLKNSKKDAFVRRKAADALGMIGKDAKEAVPALTESLKDAVVRNEAAVALGFLGSAAKDALPVLMELDQSKDKDKVFRMNVAEAIKRIQGKK